MYETSKHIYQSQDPFSSLKMINVRGREPYLIGGTLTPSHSYKLRVIRIRRFGLNVEDRILTPDSSDSFKDW